MLKPVPIRNKNETWTYQQVDQLFKMLGYPEFVGYFKGLGDGQAELNRQSAWLDNVACYLSRISNEDRKGKHKGKWFTACATCKYLIVFEGEEKPTLPYNCFYVHSGWVSRVNNEIPTLTIGPIREYTSIRGVRGTSIQNY
jgi:hypothetical protein